MSEAIRWFLQGWTSKNRAQAHPIPARLPIVFVQEANNRSLDRLSNHKPGLLQSAIQNMSISAQCSVQSAVVDGGCVCHLER
eukprot:7327235-Alexandrium_andersonii.AAC.1